MRSCENKNCPSKNYSILEVYLSDVNGNPITNSLLTCTSGLEQIAYISFKYQTSANSQVDNARLFAGLKVGEESEYLNYFFGVIPPATDLPGVLTLSNFPISWTCGVEVSLINPLLTWTTNSTADLSQTYTCNSYPQCQYQSDIIVNAPLAVQFDYTFTCPTNGETSVAFRSISNGGREPYQYSWTFTNASISGFNNPNPVVNFYGPGTATLRVTDANGTVSTYHSDLNIPSAFEFYPEIIHQTEEDSADGSIRLEMNTLSDYTFAWVGPNGFLSDEQDIYGLTEGIYVLTVTDEFGCSEVMDFEIMYLTTLPLLADDLDSSLKENNQAVRLSWSGNPQIGRGHFEVERAFENINYFNVVGKLSVTDRDSETLNFHFTDRTFPKFHSRIYYRIKLVPEFGKSIYTSIIKVDVPLVQSDMKWSAFPNPFENNLQLKYLGNELPLGGLIRIQIYSPSTNYTYQFTTKEHHVHLENIVKSAPKGLLIIEIKYLDKVDMVKVFKK
ncbi:MAG TPA: PKD domain-containing protein [Lunatimonas sp.]|nr:PKD domain-containing protein [Lunatimonas sp.]